MVLFAEWLPVAGHDPASHTVLTVDHGLRTQSRAEADAVSLQAAALGYRHATLVWREEKPHAGIQSAARRARYRLMGTYMLARGIPLLLTAHTRDDQAETLIMRLARGSGLDGLSAMAPCVDLADVDAEAVPQPGAISVARPLLDVPKRRLVASLQARGIAWIDDPSNQSPAFERARLRRAAAALDALGLTHDKLALSARRLRRARSAIDAAVVRFCTAHVRASPCGYFTLSRAGLCGAHAEIRVRVLGRAIAGAGGSGEPVPLGKLEAVAEALSSADPEASRRWTLARAMITAEGEAVTVEREPGRGPLPRSTMAPGETALWDGRFQVEIGPGLEGGPVEVSALGHAGASQLRRQGVDASRVPAGAIAVLPAVWRAGTLMAVPPMDFWADPGWRAHLKADFAGQCALERAFALQEGSNGQEMS
jgi:tRNA(Ile)-lysidine synthase